MTQTCNNRPENLRWVSRLENIILNPITAKRIARKCGSVEAFLADPSKFRDKFQDQSFMWMRTVSAEEAQVSLKRLLSWANSENESSGGTLDEWIFSHPRNKYWRQDYYEPNKAIVTNESKLLKQSNPNQTETPKVIEKKPQIAVKRNHKIPPDFPYRLQIDETKQVVKYKTDNSINRLAEELLKESPFIMLPDIGLPTFGKPILIKQANLWHFENVFLEKNIKPNHFILEKQSNKLIVIFRTNKNIDEKEIERFKTDGISVLEIDLSWAKEGFTKDEIIHILTTDCATKKWLHNKMIDEAKEQLLKVCEPIHLSGRGFLHQYVVNCPINTEMRNGKNDTDFMLDCGYCKYMIKNNANKEVCFGKSNIETYGDLINIVDIVKKEEQILALTFIKDNKKFTKEFKFYDDELDALGKTLFELWDDRKGEKIIARNVYSDWYVLLEEDPRTSFTVNGFVIARLGKKIEDLQMGALRSIFAFDKKEWKNI